MCEKINRLQSQPHSFILTGLANYYSLLVEKVTLTLKTLLAERDSLKWQNINTEPEEEISSAQGLVDFLIENSNQTNSLAGFLAENTPNSSTYSQSNSRIVVINQRIREEISLLEKLTLLLTDLWLVCNLEENLTKPLVLYFPIHVDTSLRMYHSNTTNLVGNKVLRLFRVDIPRAFEEESDLIFRFYLSCQIRRVNSASSALSKKQIIEAVPEPHWRDSLKFSHYRDKYLLGEDFLIWVDATACVIQLYSVLFGDIKYAKWSNLLGGDYSDVYSQIIAELKYPPEWTPAQKALLSNRKYIKDEIMFYFYAGQRGEAIFRTRKYLCEEKSTESAEVIDLLRLHLDIEFKSAFVFKKLLVKFCNIRKSYGKNIEWNFQGNRMVFTHMKTKESFIRLKSGLLKSSSNKFAYTEILEDKVDTEKHKRKILTSLCHSTESFSAVELRLALLDLGCFAPSVHDAYAINARFYSKACSIYKQVLWSRVFTQKISSFLILGEELHTEILREELLTLEKEIAIRKKNPEWGLFLSTSGYPLYPE